MKGYVGQSRIMWQEMEMEFNRVGNVASFMQGTGFFRYVHDQEVLFCFRTTKSGDHKL